MLPRYLAFTFYITGPAPSRNRSSNAIPLHQFVHCSCIWSEHFAHYAQLTVPISVSIFAQRHPATRITLQQPRFSTTYGRTLKSVAQTKYSDLLTTKAALEKIPSLAPAGFRLSETQQGVNKVRRRVSIVEEET
jgi:hypothetical protein